MQQKDQKTHVQSRNVRNSWPFSILKDTAVRNCGGAYRAKGLIVGAPET
jgi:hypothetical protein